MSAQTLATMAPHELLTLARRHGVHWHFVPMEPAQLLIWGARGAMADRIVNAMRDRADALIATIAANRPALLPTSTADEPDFPIDGLPWAILRAMIVGVVLDVLAAQEIEAELQRGHDAIVADEAVRS
ncbi:MAG: hypothetical protein ACYDAR_22045 [Thermomicrobiales bacterium]